MGILSSLRKGVGNTLVRIIYGNFHFDNTCEVPEQLGEHVTSSKKDQAKWYKKLLKAWKGAKPPPKTPEQASRLVMQTLHRHPKADVEGLLKFYGLPVLQENYPPPWPKGVKFELHTLPVDAELVPDGDGLTVYGYRILKGSNNEEVLARKYRIRFRGIDAPENKQPFGEEAKKELTKLVQGKCVIVHVYGKDQHGRHVGDVYCNGEFVQEIMLKKGLAWHYAFFDKRPQLKK
ncbi:hypothetical protein MKW94_030164, partial [Papaver nudicaule]|nr:hypothetical protein [Papaver nudicaule]